MSDFLEKHIQQISWCFTSTRVKLSGKVHWLRLWPVLLGQHGTVFKRWAPIISSSFLFFFFKKRKKKRKNEFPPPPRHFPRDKHCTPKLIQMGHLRPKTNYFFLLLFELIFLFNCAFHRHKGGFYMCSLIVIGAM